MNYASVTMEETRPRRTTGPCCHLWPYRTERICTTRAGFPSLIPYPRTKCSFELIRIAHQVYRGVLLFHGPPEGDCDTTCHLPVRHLMLSTNRLQYSPLPTAGRYKVNGAESSGGDNGQSPEAGATEGEAVNRYVGMVCATVCEAILPSAPPSVCSGLEAS